jgi:spore germination protein YaaH
MYSHDALNRRKCNETLRDQWTVITYEAKKNDTVLGLALRFSTTTKIIEHMNHLENRILTPGQVLTVSVVMCGI